MLILLEMHRFDLRSGQFDHDHRELLSSMGACRSSARSRQDTGVAGFLQDTRILKKNASGRERNMHTLGKQLLGAGFLFSWLLTVMHPSVTPLELQPLAPRLRPRGRREASRRRLIAANALPRRMPRRFHRFGSISPWRH